MGRINFGFRVRDSVGAHEGLHHDAQVIYAHN
jgi:hypothetical protein